MKKPELLAKNVIGSTYNTIQGTIVQGDVEGLQQAINSSGSGGTVIMAGIIAIVIVAGIIETGTLLGVILPSDIILSASVLALVGLGKRWMVVIVTILSIVFTIVGDQLGYYTGYKLGSSLYDRQDTRYFKKKYLLQAQEALNKSGERFLYIGRFVSFGGFLPTIYGMMKWDKQQFLRVSVISAIIWKLSIIIPLVLLMLIFPGLRGRVALLLLLAAAVPEIIGWIMLLRPQAQEYIQRLTQAKEQIKAIRKDFVSMGNNMGELWNKVVTHPQEASSRDGGTIHQSVGTSHLSEQAGLHNQHNNHIAPSQTLGDGSAYDGKISTRDETSQMGYVTSDTNSDTQLVNGALSEENSLLIPQAGEEQITLTPAHHSNPPPSDKSFERSTQTGE